MAENLQRNRGRPSNYKFDRGGAPTEMGPYIGIVKNNIDSIRSGRLQVYIQEFEGPQEDVTSNWRTVNYLPPFYGTTEHTGSAEGTGDFVGNKHTYGMWFTPPDIGTRVLCFFVAGDPNQGYYVGCVPEPGLNHMVPAIGASRKFERGNDSQQEFFKNTQQLPVTEINTENKQILDDPRFFDRSKPVHAVLAGTMFQQGVINDVVRGPITSNSQRESPSSVYGISTPGKPIYAGGLDESTIKNKLQSGKVTPDQIKVIGRRGGHTIVMDDGDIDGVDQLVRIRTAKGHQISLSDNGDCIYIIHANGQSWIELGKEGTLDVFSTNSVNVRTQGTINLHADKDINMYAGNKINLSAKAEVNIESQSKLNMSGTNSILLYSKQNIGVRSDGTLALKASKVGSFDGGSQLDLKGGCIGLNSGGGLPVDMVPAIKKQKVSDTFFNAQQGWFTSFGALESIVSRAPSHEPWPYHNLGTDNSVDVGGEGQGSLTGMVLTALTSIEKINPIGINPVDFAKQIPSLLSVGSIDNDQVTGMLAQLTKDVGQGLFDITPEKGIGIFGMTAENLELGGYLKPGTVSRFLSADNLSAIITNPLGRQISVFKNVLSNPSVWTGLNGADELGSFLGDGDLQTQAQSDIFIRSLGGLQNNSIVTGTENPADVAALVQATSVHGLSAVGDWLKGTSDDPALLDQIKQTARNAQFAVTMVNSKISSTDLTYSTPGAYSNTTLRAGVDQALKAVIGSDKVPTPIYTPTRSTRT